MAWLDLHQSIRQHRKTFALVDRLGLPAPHVVGHLCFLWLWAIDNTDPNGELGDVSVGTLARASEWLGKPEDWVSALVDCGWLEFRDKKYTLHDWLDYGGKYQVKRDNDVQRKRLERAKDVQAPSNGHPVDVQAPSAPRREEKGSKVKREKEKGSKEKPGTESGLAASLSDWALYLTEHWEPFVTDDWQAGIITDYPMLDLLTEAKKAVDWWAGTDKHRPKRPTSAFRNWLIQAIKILAAPPSANGSGGRTSRVDKLPARSEYGKEGQW